MTTIKFLDYTLNNEDCDTITKKCLDLMDGEKQSKIVNTINAHSTVTASDDPQFKKVLQESDMLLADGIAVVLACRLKKQQIAERVSGYDFFESISQKSDAKGNKDKIRFFFLGSSESVLEKITQRMKRDYPNIEIAGTYSPPFKAEFSDEDNKDMCAAVNKANADILWVGMTAPKQEKWLAENHKNLNVHFSAAIGAVFDFYAETKSRAPQWIQKSGFEWLYRLVLEPTRMWRRYIINNPRFIKLVLTYKGD